MISKYQKYVNAMFLVAAAAVWLISKHYFEVILGYFQLGRRINPDVVNVMRHSLPIFLGTLTFVILRKNSTTYNFTTDAVGELVKVVWPTKKDVQVGTIVVIVAVLLSGVFFGVIDLVITSLVKAILNV